MDEIDKKCEARDEIAELIKSMDSSQLKHLIAWWWSEDQIGDRIIEEMDDNWISQMSLEQINEDLEHVKKIHKKEVVDITK